MIKSIKIENFKSIKNLEIDLAPLTIFAGPNGSGKSSVLEAVALMAQSISENKAILESIRGELVDFEDRKNVFCRENERQWLSLGCGADVEIKDLVDSLEKDLSLFLGEVEALAESDLKKLLTAHYLWLEEFRRKLRSVQKRKKNVVSIEYLYKIRGVRPSSYELSYSVDSNQITFKREGRKLESVPVGLQVREPRKFLAPFSIFDYESAFFHTLGNALRSKMRQVYYLSAERGFIPWIYEPAPKPATWVGKRGEHTLEILTKLIKPEYDDKRLPYELFCDKFGIKYAWAGWHEKKFLTSNYKDPFLTSSHKFPSLGFGSKQLLSVITQLAYSDSESIILIEEPELSLHPAYQRLLPALFARAVNEGKQILVTTHSSYFPLSLGSVLKRFRLSGQTTRGRRRFDIELSEDDIRVYDVKRNRIGYTQAKKLRIDKNGLTQAIPSFVKVEREILGRFISKE